MINRDKPTGLTRVVRAFGYSLQGFRHAWREEAAFRQELCLAVAVVPAGLYLGRSGVERALLVWPDAADPGRRDLEQRGRGGGGPSGMERHPLAGMAKDMGSAAVMLSFVIARNRVAPHLVRSLTSTNYHLPYRICMLRSTLLLSVGSSVVRAPRGRSRGEPAVHGAAPGGRDAGGSRATDSAAGTGTARPSARPRTGRRPSSASPPAWSPFRSTARAPSTRNGTRRRRPPAS